MAKILNIETSSYACSVALCQNGEISDFIETIEDKSHASLLTVLISNILKKNNLKVSELDAVSVSKGPGSYTGLRIGVSAAKGICYGANIPLLSVCSLHSMSYGIVHDKKYMENIPAVDHTVLCPMIDARRMEVYTAMFDINSKQTGEIKALIIEKDTFSDMLDTGKMIFFGNGADKCKQVIKHKNALFIDGFHPSARYMSVISEENYNTNIFENTAYFEPFYLKDFIPTVPKNKII